MQVFRGVCIIVSQVFKHSSAYFSIVLFDVFLCWSSIYVRTVSVCLTIAFELEFNLCNTRCVIRVYCDPWSTFNDSYNVVFHRSQTKHMPSMLKRSGVHGSLKPSVGVSLNVPYLLCSFWKKVFVPPNPSPWQNGVTSYKCAMVSGHSC